MYKLKEIIFKLAFIITSKSSEAFHTPTHTHTLMYLCFYFILFFISDIFKFYTQIYVFYVKK